MTHAAALAAAAHGIHKVIASALGICPSLVDMQCRGERLTPAEKVERIVVTARLFHEPEQAELPFMALADSLGYLPPIRREVIDGEATTGELADLMRAAADLVDAKTESLIDGETDEEAARLDASLARVSYLVTRERMDLELRTVAQRIGPKRAPRVEVQRRATA